MITKEETVEIGRAAAQASSELAKAVRGVGEVLARASQAMPELKSLAVTYNSRKSS